MPRFKASCGTESCDFEGSFSALNLSEAHVKAKHYHETISPDCMPLEKVVTVPEPKMVFGEDFQD